jgi:hypothetical protein
MPRYFFDIWRDDEEAPDEDGCDLPDLAAVKAELCETVAELAKEELRRHYADQRALRVKVRNANGRHIFQARFQFDLQPLDTGAETLSSRPRSARDSEH